MRILISKLELAIESFARAALLSMLPCLTNLAFVMANFLRLVRGFGMAVGFTLIGAAFIFLKCLGLNSRLSVNLSTCSQNGPERAHTLTPLEDRRLPRGIGWAKKTTGVMAVGA